MFLYFQTTAIQRQLRLNNLTSEMMSMYFIANNMTCYTQVLEQVCSSGLKWCMNTHQLHHDTYRDDHNGDDRFTLQSGKKHWI